MARIVNDTQGLICVDVPQTVKEQIDPMSAMLDSFDFSAPMGLDVAVKLLVADRIGDRLAKAQAVQARRDAQLRAGQTVDLYPGHQGEGRPERVNEIPDDIWDRVKKMPVVQQKLDTRQLRVL